MTYDTNFWGEIFVSYNLKKSIVLIGLMGAGKTSVGSRLSEKLNIPFVDSDSEIEIAAGMTVSEIFFKFGENYFRAGEERVLERLLIGDPKILATGGGAFVSSKIRGLIKKSSISVWLRADLETLWSRVQGKNTRPLLHTDNPKSSLAKLINERNPIYSNADIIIDSPKNITHSSMVIRLIRALKKQGVLNNDSEN